MAQTTTQIATEGIGTMMSSTDVVTNFNVGSGIRSLIDTFSAQMAVESQQSEDQVATGILNALQQALGITPSNGVGSVYNLQFSLSSSATQSYTLYSGTTATIPNSTLQWVVGQTVTVPVGGSTTVTATCKTTGAITNVPANSITQLVVPVANLSVTNLSAQPVIQGQDPDTTVQIQAKIANKIAELQSGSNSSIEAAVLQAQVTDSSGNPTEQVVKAKFYDGTTAGTGTCYVFNGVGSASSALLTQAQNLINGYTDTNGNLVEGPKPAGTQITVSDATQTAVNVSVAVMPVNGTSFSAVQSAVETAITDYFNSLDIDSSFSPQQLGKLILSIGGVWDVQMTAPTGVQTPSANGNVYVAGTVTVTQATT